MGVLKLSLNIGQVALRRHTNFGENPCSRFRDAACFIPNIAVRRRRHIVDRRTPYVCRRFITYDYLIPVHTYNV